VGLYVLNQKRDRLVHLEQRYGLRVDVLIDRHMTGDQLELTCTEQKVAAEVEEVVEAVEPVEAVEGAEEDAEAGGRKRRRRRRRKRRPGEEVEQAADQRGRHEADAGHEAAVEADEPARAAVEEAPAEPVAAGPQPDVAAEPAEKRPRRRRRRSSRAEAVEAAVPEMQPETLEPGVEVATDDGQAEIVPEPAMAGAAGRGRSSNGAGGEQPVLQGGVPELEMPELAETERRPPQGSPEPARLSAAPHGDELSEAEPEEVAETEMPSAAVVDRDPDAAPRRGWWSRFVRKDD
jgi:ribonuclease E